MDRIIFKFIALLAMAVGAATYAPKFVVIIFFLVILIYYYRAEGEEPFWLAFFLVIQDGILGYFDNFEQLIPIIPGLPDLEVGQLYIGLTLIKAAQVRQGFRPFYGTTMFILLVYLIFLVLEGYTWGLSMKMNVQFRVVKWLLPLFLLYSMPKLMNKREDYDTFFQLIFPVAFTVVIAQLFTVLTGISPAQYLGVSIETNPLFAVSESITYRGFYNDNILLITLFGALFYLNVPHKRFPHWYLYLVILSNCISVYLSATRGWVLAFAFILITFVIWVSRIRLVRILQIGLISVIFIVFLYSMPILRIQFENASERMLTLNALAEGDLSAGGTLIRLEKRSPRVMKVWRKSPLTGIGFSNEYFKYGDIHVGNQSILLHSGIVGVVLIAFFLGEFCIKLFMKSLTLPFNHQYKKVFRLFIIFLLGWFIIHSSTSQQFGYHQEPERMIILALFLTFAAVVYQDSQDVSSKNVEWQSSTNGRLSKQVSS